MKFSTITLYFNIKKLVLTMTTILLNISCLSACTHEQEPVEMPLEIKKLFLIAENNTIVLDEELELLQVNFIYKEPQGNVNNWPVNAS